MTPPEGSPTFGDTPDAVARRRPVIAAHIRPDREAPCPT